MAWRKLEDTFYDSPKIRRLARHLGVGRAQAAGHIALLWSWSLRHAPDGDLTRFDHEDIEHAVDWSGPCGDFVAGCLKAGLFDASPAGHITIHNWCERGGTYAESQRKQRNRARHKMSRDIPGQIGTVAGQNETVTKCPALEKNRIEEKRIDNIHGDVSDPPTVEPATQPAGGQPGADAPALSALAGGNGKAIDESKPARDDIQAVWRHYRTHHPKTTKMLRSNRREYQLIQAALQDWTVDELTGAIDGYHRSAWHRGENDRNKAYLSLTLILRDISHIQAGLEMLQPKTNGSRRRLLDPTPLVGNTDERKGKQ